MSSQLYILTVNVNIGLQGGIDLPSAMSKLQTLLCSYPDATRCLHTYKVTGEAKVVAVFEVTNVIGLERMVSGIARVGNMDVTCKPIFPYRFFAEYLKVNGDVLLGKGENTLAGDKQGYWLEISVEYAGKSTSELLEIWSREAVAALTARSSGGHIELWKSVMERKVHMFIAMDPVELDKLSFELPIMKENGCNVNIQALAIHDLEDYCARISSDTM
ncbi:hypothetical protein MAR_002463 [Mya arenaria]|uniref:Uncharacterized protein n=1 Tax=Mya arenaria TaxID=6604 RepID=A0ABY7FEX8_MYAAR|nr:uncharacterized protein LOC128207579 [Mya arenaria]XP_052766569.1 uncharacterized protein LOC128207579 [Mya arenaria]XP_052768913.1 uncharacterized protein LOC128209099 [Mya arenaria]XP_052768914.1 uncharacterized protein LOC128209099 [Mya arenaria]WAR18861.1 hypothetical protein MAR_000699 [Mya arenaria]WAR20625.1 hypothetical protein MAR_002463 [Mya arenaria]